MSKPTEDVRDVAPRGSGPDQVYLSVWNALGEQRRWPLPQDGRAMTMGRSLTSDVCISTDPRV